MNPLRGGLFSKGMLVAGFLFLYLPMLILVVFSFNQSRLVTVWGGWSLKWYGALFRDTQMMEALGRSLQIAVSAASLAVVLGTLAGLTLSRLGRFRSRTAFGGMITAPLVMPDVIIGLSLLLLFVSLGLDRGMLTIWIAHVTFCMAYVAVVIVSRLNESDRSLEEAAMDLGCPPVKTFFQITLPVILPAIVAGWLLAFTISLDDLVISSFVSGPSSTTLPMVVFSSVRMGLSPKINALATLLIMAVASACVLAWWVARQSEKRRTQAVRKQRQQAAAGTEQH
jgi:putrescine transport system permease protein